VKNLASTHMPSTPQVKRQNTGTGGDKKKKEDCVIF